MKPEQTERFLIEELYNQSRLNGKVSDENLQDVEKLTGDASTRKYYRLFTRTKSYVVCLDKPSDEENTFITVQKFLYSKQIRVPQIYDHNLKKGYILEEDLGDRTLLQKLGGIKNKQEEYELYQKAIDHILALHRLDKNDVNKTNMSKLSFDKKKLKEEIDFSIKYFIQNFLNVSDEVALGKLSEEFNPICERLDHKNKVLTHRDYHSRNIMVKSKDFIIIDFQDARMGVPQYDLVSLLDDCYYKVNGENKKRLIKYYYDNLPSEIHGQGSFESFKDLYYDMQIQRVFKALGSFGYIYHTREDHRYLKYIGFGMEKLRVTLLKHERYDSLRKMLYKIYYEN